MDFPTYHCVRNSIPQIAPELIIGDLYIFGSALQTTSPRDLDLLLVIDESIVPVHQAYLRSRPMVELLQGMIGLPVDLTVLTKQEERTSCFAAEVHALRVFERSRESSQATAYGAHNTVAT